jgi:hypothetical protein
MIRWTIDGRVHQNSSARKVTHLSTISTLGGSISKFHGIWVKALGLSHTGPRFRLDQGFVELTLEKFFKEVAHFEDASYVLDNV